MNELITHDRSQSSICLRERHTSLILILIHSYNSFNNRADKNCLGLKIIIIGIFLVIIINNIVAVVIVIIMSSAYKVLGSL